MPGEVKIKVGLEGQQQTTQGLAQTEGAVKGVGAAGQAAAAGMRAEGQAAAAAAAQHDAAAATAKNLAGEQERLDDAGRRAARGTEHAGAAVFDFHKKGETLTKDVLRLINPELANMADLMINVGEGMSRITAPLLAFAGIGAAIGAVAATLQEIAATAKRAADEFERMDKARTALRDAGLEQRAKLSETLAGVGVEPRADVLDHVTEMIAKLNTTGVRSDLAENAAVAQLLSGMPDDQVEQYLRGVAISGRKPIEFGGDQAKNSELIQRALKAGERPEAAGMLDSIRAAEMQTAMREAGGPDTRRPGDRETQIDTFIDRLGKDRPDLGADALGFVRKLLQRNIQTDTAEGRAALLEMINQTRTFDMPMEQLATEASSRAGSRSDYLTRRDEFERIRGEEIARQERELELGKTGRTAGELIDVAQRFREGGAGATVGATSRPTTQPVQPQNVTVIDNRVTNNVVTQHVHGPDQGSKWGPAETLPGANGD